MKIKYLYKFYFRISFVKETLTRIVKRIPATWAPPCVGSCKLCTRQWGHFWGRSRSDHRRAPDLRSPENGRTNSAWCPTATWPDLAKFRHFGKVYKSLANFWQLISYLAKCWAYILWQIRDIIGLIFIVANGQILKNNQTIWSHCLWHTSVIWTQKIN